MKIKKALFAAVLALIAVLAVIAVLELRRVAPQAEPTAPVTELILAPEDTWILDPEQRGRLSQYPALELLDLRQLDASGELYRTLTALLPDCRILWEPEFQNVRYPLDTERLTATALTEADMEALADFPALTELDATGCTDYALLRQLHADRPELQLIYTVTLGGISHDASSTELTLENLQEEQLAQLENFPALSRVNLTGTLPAPEILNTLPERFPAVEFTWSVSLLDTRYDSSVEVIDLSGTALSGTDELEAVLAYLPRLREVNLCDCGLDTDVLGPFQEEHPGVKFIWWMDLGSGNRIRTDATAFVAEPYGVKLYDSKLWQLKYCDRMVCLDLGHMPITNCSFVANMPDLKYLILAISSISDISPLAGLEKLVFLEIFKTEVVDYTPLLSCKALEDLNVCGSVGAKWETLKEMTWLKRLYLGWDGTYQRTADEIAEALPNTQVVLDPVGGSTGGDWRKGQHYFDMRDMLGKHYMEK